MIEKPRIVQTEAQSAAVIRLTIPRSEMQKNMRPAIAEVMDTIADQGFAPAGPVFAHHLKMDPEFFDFELGVPIPRMVSAAGRVIPGKLPAATVARTVYHGPYEGLPSAWSAFMEWITTEGYDPALDLWESYLVHPNSSSDPNAWRTELNRPLRI